MKDRKFIRRRFARVFSNRKKIFFVLAVGSTVSAAVVINVVWDRSGREDKYRYYSNSGDPGTTSLV